MSQTDKLIEQHVREYESRLLHIDELLAKAREKGATPESHQDLAEVTQQREQLAGHVATLKSGHDPREVEDILQHGPMGIWDVMAQKLEHVIERLEKK